MCPQFSRNCAGIVAVLLIAAFAFGAGCLKRDGGRRYLVRYAPRPLRACRFVVARSLAAMHMQPATYTTRGTPSADNVRLDLNLVNIRRHQIRDSRQIFIGTLAPGQTQSFETILDGDCTQDYRVEAYL